MQEIWKPIKDFPRYSVSSTGRVRNDITQVCLKPWLIGRGYKKIELWNESGFQRFRVHRLVADAFIPNPLNKQSVNHKDGNPCNNLTTNLEWCTSEENNKWNDFLVFCKVLEEIKKDTDIPLDALRNVAENRYKIQ